MIERVGKRTLRLTGRPYLIAHAAAVGKKEGEGPLGDRFDYVATDDRMGQKSWELAESALQRNAINLAVHKAGLQKGDLILSIDGTPISTWQEMSDTIAASNGATLTMEIGRKDAQGRESVLEVQLAPERSTRKTLFGETETAWLIGIRSSGAIETR